MIAYNITHLTTYTYTEPVSLCQNVARLTPRDTDSQKLERTRLAVLPEPVTIDRSVDAFGNSASHFSIREPHRALRIEAEHRVTLTQRRLPAASLTAPWDAALPHGEASLLAAQFLHDSRYVRAAPDYADYARPSFPPGRPILEGGSDLARRIHTDFAYDPTATTVATPTRDVFRTRRGVCQDFAHLQLSCLRSLGVPARYVSGYLATVPAPGQLRLVGADASHAWISVFCGGDGWIDLDPTNNQYPGERHIVLAWGRDYDDVSPVKGVILGGGQHEVSVSVDARVVEARESGPAPNFPNRGDV